VAELEPRVIDVEDDAPSLIELVLKEDAECLEALGQLERSLPVAVKIV
jgi:hypothetical protein